MYLDPGSGSFLLQILVATVAGAGIFLATYWRKVKSFFTRKSGKARNLRIAKIIKMSKTEKVAGSFRDPNGFLFTRGGNFYRQVNKQYSQHYDLLMKSGLYEKLVNDGLLIRHKEVGEAPVDRMMLTR